MLPRSDAPEGLSHRLGDTKQTHTLDLTGAHEATDVHFALRSSSAWSGLGRGQIEKKKSQNCEL